MRLVVCVPTYNERANVEPLLRKLGEVLAALSDEARVLVIDDASPDGTGEVAAGLARELPWLDVLRRPAKTGLGPAYLAGFRHALAHGANVVAQMDCDFSHDPSDVPRLVEALANADVVVGSRYVAGGAIRDWGLPRRALSRFGSVYARSILGVGLTDLTSGFKCYRRDVLEALELDAIDTRGYAFQIETTYRALRKGFEVVEIPIVFTERASGRSKMTSGIALEAAVRVPALRLRALRGRL
ncbi:MAG: polyprenol monophosphomannose synthase [Actinobacteria bacterium]|nr:polyprenol monophosphomannose synthase [Actinomycetota bacterium]